VIESPPRGDAGTCRGGSLLYSATVSDVRPSQAPFGTSGAGDGHENQLRRAVQMLLRRLRAGHRAGRDAHDHMLGEVIEQLGALLDELGPLHLRVGMGQLSYAGAPLCEYSPREDPAVFRLFQHGVRQLSFLPGLIQEELADFVDVLTTDLSGSEFIEEDITTLLASRDLRAIQFVVVETFSEGEGTAEGGQTGDVAAIVAAALRQSLADLGADESTAQQQDDSTIRFWSADVRFLETANLPDLMASFQSADGRSAGSSVVDEELQSFAEELSAALARPSPWLAGPVLRTLGIADGKDAERLALLLARDLLEDARLNGFSAAAPQLREALDWIERQADDERAATMVEALFDPEICALVTREVTGEPDVSSTALDFLRLMPEDRVAEALAATQALGACPARTLAIEALIQGGGAGLSASADLLSTCDAEAALAVLWAAREEGGSPEAVLAFRAGLGHGDLSVRLTALGWFACHGEHHAVGILGEALRDPAPDVRLAALYLIGRTQATAGPAIIKAWLDSEPFEDLPLDEKRRAALVLARIGGVKILPAMREIAERSGGMLKRQRKDETRAVAVAALGALVDDESVGLISSIAEARTAGAAQQEARHVMDCFEAGKIPYQEPIAQAHAQLSELGLLEFVWPEVRRPRAAAAPSTALDSDPTTFAAGGRGATAAVPAVARDDFDALTRARSVPVRSPSVLPSIPPAVPRPAPTSRPPERPLPSRPPRSSEPARTTARPRGPALAARPRAPDPSPQAEQPVAAPPDAPAAAESVPAPKTLDVALLLEAFSFDDLPRAPGSGDPSGDDDG